MLIVAIGFIYVCTAVAWFVLGSTIVGIMLGLLTYFIVFNIVRSYRLRRWGRLMPPSAGIHHEWITSKSGAVTSSRTFRPTGARSLSTEMTPFG